VYNCLFLLPCTAGVEQRLLPCSTCGRQTLFASDSDSVCSCVASIGFGEQRAKDWLLRQRLATAGDQSGAVLPLVAALEGRGADGVDAMA
jgi:hypothetical protein